MKFKSKDIIIAIIITTVAVTVLLAAKSMGFASSKSGTRIGYFSNEGWDIWSAQYVMLDGTMEKNLYSQDEEITISVITESGNISIEILDSDGNALFDQENIKSGSYSVSAEQKVIVRITADHHKGSFEIKG